MTFIEIVEITERIKQILNISNEVALKALNAMLIARQSGENGRGFQVVSGELRRFSQRLEVSMAEIMELVSDLVVAVAVARRHDRLSAYYCQLFEDDATSEHVQKIASRHESERRASELSIIEQRNRLFDRLVNTRRACAEGATVSRAARIEAVHGGALAKQLTQVAMEVEVTVGCIEDAIKLLEKSFAAKSSGMEKVNEEVAFDLSTRKSQVGGDRPGSGEAELRDRHQRVCDRPRQRIAHR